MATPNSLALRIRSLCSALLLFPALLNESALAAGSGKVHPDGDHMIYSHLPAVLRKDVVIVGGGASGTYAAVRLLEDYNKSVLLVEMEAELGGHVDTYFLSPSGGHDHADQAQGQVFNYGVQTYIDYPGAKYFFRRFNISTQPNVQFPTTNTVLVDPDTGKIASAPSSPPPPPNETISAVQKYLGIISPFDKFQSPGYWDFPDEGSKMPADYLVPFDEFVKKHNLEAIQPALNLISGQSITSKRLTMFVIKNFGVPVVKGWLEGSYFVPKPFDNSLLYRRAEELLQTKESVMLSSQVVQVDDRPPPPSSNHSKGTSDTARGDGLIRVIVKNLKTGDKTLILAKRILIASPPSLENLSVLKLDAKEQSIFGGWGYFLSLHTAVVRITSRLRIADGTSIFLSKPVNGTSATFSLVWNGVPGYYWVVFRAEGGLSAQEVERTILGVVERIEKSGVFDSAARTDNKRHRQDKSEVVAISNHSQVAWGMSVDQIREKRFFTELYGMQGYRDTWYTGGLWCSDYSSIVWAFTDTILDRMVGGDWL